MGHVSHNFVVGIAIGIIVIAVSLGVFAYLSNLEIFFPNDLNTLKKYSTCALAYCAAGGSDERGFFSDEVNAVGCLKYKGGKCELSCVDVEEKIFQDRYSFREPTLSITCAMEENKDSPECQEFLKVPRDNYGRKHFCGKENYIPFEFDGNIFGGTVNLKSGQMDKITKDPYWVCKSLAIGPLELDVLSASIPGVNTADWQYHGLVGDPFGLKLIDLPQNCIMLRKTDTDVRAYTEIGLIISSFFTGGATKGVGVAAKTLKIPILTSTVKVVAEKGVVNVLKTTGKVLSGQEKVKITLSLPKRGQIQKWFVKGSGKAFVVTTVEGGAERLVSSVENSENTGGGDLGSLNSKSRGGCFTGYVYDWENDNNPSNEDLLYTPIIQYEQTEKDSEGNVIKEGTEYKKVFPSAIYVDESFIAPLSDSQRPECQLFNPGRLEIDAAGGKEKFIQNYIEQHRADYEGASVVEEIVDDGTDPNTEVDDTPVLDDSGNPIRTERELTPEEIEDLLRSEAIAQADSRLQPDPIVGLDGFPLPGLDRLFSFDFGNMLSECSFKTHYNGEKITYKVWASPTFPGAGTLNSASKFGYDVVDVDIGDTEVTKDDISGFASDSISASADSYGFFQKSYEWALDQLGINPDDSARSTADAFSRFGSCAYVTLDRELPEN